MSTPHDQYRFPAPRFDVLYLQPLTEIIISRVVYQCVAARPSTLLQPADNKPLSTWFPKSTIMPNTFVMFFEVITKWVDDGSPIDVIYLDFQKAVDKVPHQRLILKIKSHGMGNSIINWIEQWLSDRRQRVVVDGEVSSWKSVLSGVPQGSVLGPILFVVYINDLEEGLTGNILKFADDTKLFIKTKEIGDNFFLQDDIDKLVK